MIMWSRQVANSIEQQSFKVEILLFVCFQNVNAMSWSTGAALPSFLKSGCIASTRIHVLVCSLKITPLFLVLGEAGLCSLQINVPILRASQVVLVAESPPANAGDLRASGSRPGPRRPPAWGHGNPPQENPMDGGPWQATVRAVSKSQTGLSN